MADPEAYEILIVRYAHIGERFRHQNFIMTDAHETRMPIDFFVWIIRNENRTLVVDTGFDHEEGAKRGRVITRLPREGLAMANVDAANLFVTMARYGAYDDMPFGLLDPQGLVVAVDPSTPDPGTAAMPMLQVTGIRRPLCSNVCAATAARIRSASLAAPSRGVPGRISPSSSPPKIAVRRRSRPCSSDWPAA